MTGEHPQSCETCHHYESGGQWCIPVKTRLSQLEIELIALVGCASHSSASEPVPVEDCDRCRFVKDCTPLYVPPCYNGAAVEAAKQAREKVLELLSDLKGYADGEYEESNLSDNEREMRIHLEYTNRIWGIMRSLRGGAP